MNQVSCLFLYAKKAYRFENGETVPVLNADGSHRANDNYLSFLQVISTYWEPTDNPNNPNQLNIFLNGGSISVDSRSGERQMKAGYTVKLPEFLGKRFMQEYYNWSCRFGLSAAPTYPTTANNRTDRSETHRTTRQVRPEDFVDINESDGPIASIE